MARVRKTWREAWHDWLGARTVCWKADALPPGGVREPPTGPPSGLPAHGLAPAKLEAYLLREGVGHLLVRGRHREAVARMLELTFMEALLEASEDFIKPLKLWRAVGLEHMAGYADALRSHTGSPLLDFDTRVRACDRVARFLEDAGCPEISEVLSRWVLSARQRSCGPENPATLRSARGLVTILAGRGAIDEAEALAREVLEATERTLGADHLDTRAARTVLAHTLSARRGEAASLYAQVLADHRRLGDAGATETLGAVNNLGTALFRARDYVASIDLFREAFEGRKAILGDGHPATLAALGNLASALHLGGDLEGARLLYEATLTARRRILGPDHPATLETACNISNLLEDQGFISDAEALCRETLARGRRRLGAGHPDVLGVACNLMALLRASEQSREGEALARETFEAALLALGGAHATTRRALFELALFLCARAAGRQGPARTDDASPEALHQLALRVAPAEELPRLVGAMALKLRGRGFRSAADALWQVHQASQRDSGS
jgi:tetratricopeptide (TPR) repeat protein